MTERLASWRRMTRHATATIRDTVRALRALQARSPEGGFASLRRMPLEAQPVYVRRRLRASRGVLRPVRTRLRNRSVPYLVLLFSLWLGMAPDGAYAQVAVGSVTSTSGSESSFTLPHEAAGEDRLLIVGISLLDENSAVTGVTFGGEPLSSLEESIVATGPRVEVWHLVDPPTGAGNSVVVGLDATRRAVVGAISFTGVNQSSPLTGAVSDGSSDSGLPELTVASSDGDLVMDVVARATTGTFGPNPGQEEQWKENWGGPSNGTGAASTKPGESSVTMTWIGNAAKWAGVAFNVNAAPATGGSISGTKFHDVDGNGFFIGDPGLPGVNVYLYVDGGDEIFDGGVGDDVLVGVEVTDVDGHFSFEGLAPGRYYLTEDADELLHLALRQTAGGDVFPTFPYYTIVLSADEHVTVKDFANKSLPIDFGDAPDPPYPTLLVNDGARHVISSGLMLGETVDGELDGQPHPTADADGDDGVTFLTSIVAFSGTSSTASVKVVASEAGKLQGWIDFGQDGNWLQAGDQIFSDEDVVAGSNVLSFDVPAGAMPGTTFARFRLSTQAGLAPTGLAIDGEVEDYQVTILDGDAGEIIGEVQLPPDGGDFTVSLDGTDLVVGGSELFRAPFNSIAELIVTGSDEDDHLAIDFENGDPVPPGGLTFHGGVGDDALTLDGGNPFSPDVVTHTFDNASDGSVHVDGSTIHYTGLAPIFDLLTVPDRVFTFGPGGLSVVLEDDGDPTNGLSFIDSDGSEEVTFANPTNSLTINLGTGDDVLTVNAMDEGFEADLIVNDAGGDDTITLNDVYASGLVAEVVVNGGDGDDTITLNDVFQSGTAGATITVNGGDGDDTITVLATALPDLATHALNGGEGEDTFNLVFSAGLDVAPDAEITIDGGSPSNALPGDVLNVLASASGDGPRSIEVLYNSDATSDVTLLGLGTASGIHVLDVETLNYEGDAANDDVATVTYTPNLDVVTVEPTGLDAAAVYLNGSPFIPGPLPMDLDAPGVAGSEPGPDLTFSGLAATDGLLLDGGDPTTIPGDELYYHGTGFFEITGPAQGTILAPGLLDVDFVSFENHFSSGLAHVHVTAGADAGDTVPDEFIVAMLNADEVIVRVNGVIKHKHELNEVGVITIDGSTDDDHLIVDFSLGNPIPVGGLFFNGGDGSDEVTLDDGSFDTITHSFANASDGTVRFEGPGDRLLTYTGLEPITDNLDAVNRVFDFSGADDVITVEWYSGAVNYAIIETTPPTSETVVFPYPTGSLTINGNDGDDTIVVEALIGSFNADVIVNGGDGDDEIFIHATVGTGSYEVNGGPGDDVIHTFATPTTVISSFTVNGDDGDDTFHIQPDVVPVTVNGGNPTLPDFPGDVLHVDLSNVLDDAITITSTGDGFWSFSNRETITFTSIEALYEVADLKIKKKANDPAPLVGDQVTFNITLTNEGTTGHALDVEVLDLLPPGLFFLASGGDGTYDASTGLWNVGDVPINQQRVLTITAEMRASTAVTNAAQVIRPAGYFKYPGTHSDGATIVPLEQTTFWRNANRQAGTITSIAFGPSAPKSGSSGVLFAGSDGGGVFRSFDLGDNWFPVGGSTLDGAHVRELVVSKNSGALWVGTYGKGAWRSTDGVTFAQVFDGATESDFVLSATINTFNPTPPGAGTDGDVFLGTDNQGIFFSNTSGASWSDVSSGLPNLRITSIFVEAGGAGAGLDRIWVGTYGSGVFYKDYVAGPALGPGWTAANGTASSSLTNRIVFDVILDMSGHVFAGTNGGIFRSTDAGATWELVEDGKADPFDQAISVRTLLTHFDGVTEFIWAGTDGDFIFRSMTPGVGLLGDPGTWEQQTGFPALNGTDGLQSATIYDLFFTGGFLYAATRDKGIHRSSTQGLWWDQISDVVLNPVVQAMAFSSDGARLFAGSYGWGILMSDDFDGSTFVNWTRINNGLVNPWIYALAVKGSSPSDLIFAGTWGNGVFRSHDDGETWHGMGLPRRIIHDLVVSPDGSVYAATNSGAVARTVDNGITWQEIGVATTAIWALGVNPADPGRLYAGTAGDGIYFSENGGITWARTGLTERHVFAIAFDESVFPPAIYAATATGIVRSFDDGLTWSDFSTGLTVPETRTLSVIATGTPGEPLLTAGTWGGGVFTFDWAVNSWVRDGFGQAPIVAFAINPITRDGFVSTNDGGLYRKLFPAAATATTAEAADVEIPSAFELDQNYPNPFNPVTTIHFSLPESGHARLVVFDALGRQVRLLQDSVLPAGRHRVTFEAGDLPSGTYLYQLATHSQVLNRKMVVVK